MELEFETRLRRVINTTIEGDIPKYARMTIAATQKLKGFTPNNRKVGVNVK